MAAWRWFEAALLPEPSAPYAVSAATGACAMRLLCLQQELQMRISRYSFSLGVFLAMITGAPLVPAALAQAEKHDTAASMTPATPDRDMAQVLQKLMELGAKPLSTLTVEAARAQPTPADAVKALLKSQNREAAAMALMKKVSKQDMTYPAGGGTQPIRIYTPEGKAPTDGKPVIVFYHGGGFVIADLDVYETSAIVLASKSGAIVASVEYRHAPENRFPAAHEDAFAAYKWVLDNASSFGGDARRVAVAGESAGGNLALNVAIMARDQKLAAPMHMLLVYPVAGNDTETPSYIKNAQAAPLGKADMLWFFDKVLAKPEDKNDSRLNLVGAADLKNLPGATVITAEIDPLMSEGKTLAGKLKAAGSQVDYQHFVGVTHEFFGMGALLRKADRAESIAAANLRKAFSAKIRGAGR
jgi:acetyl esterase